MLDSYPLDYRNRFDELRIAAACLVIISHSWPLFGQEGPEPLGLITGHLTGGALAVTIFFVISGFLVYRSAENSQWQRFFVARALRIIPGATVCAVLCAFVLGPAVTTLDHAQYFSDLKTWEFLKNGVPLKIQYYLPGVFADLPHPNAVNGSLWTLPKEIGLYAACAVIVYLLPRRAALPIVLAASALMLIFGSDFLASGSRKWLWTIYFSWYFFSGAAFYIYRAYVPISPVLAILSGLMLVATSNTSLFPVAVAGGLPYLVIWCAFAGTGKERRRLIPDISYGLYIYGFPVQQTLMFSAGHFLSFYELMLGSLAGAAMLGTLSWYAIEKPALRYKSRFNFRQQSG